MISKYTIRRYKRSRFWGIYEGEELVALCVYKKGAVIVREVFDERDALLRNPPRDLCVADRSYQCRT